MCYIAAMAYFCSLAVGTVDAQQPASKPILERTQKQNTEVAGPKAEAPKDRRVELHKNEKSGASKSSESKASKSEKADRTIPTCKSSSWESSEVWVNGKLVDSSDFKSPVSADCNAMQDSWERYYDGQRHRSAKGFDNRLRFNSEEF